MSNLILAAAGLVVLWLFLLVFVYASFRIPTDSMEPTLVPGDYVLVNKLLIGPRLFNLTEALKGKRVNIRRLPGLYDIQRNDVLVVSISPSLPRRERLRCTSSNTMSTLYCLAGRHPFHQERYLPNQQDGRKPGKSGSATSHRTDETGRFPGRSFPDIPLQRKQLELAKIFGPLYIPKAGTEVGMDRFKFLFI